MAKSRMINTKFWDDAYTSNLDPIEKLLFLYFLTNTSTNISGIYEIPLKKVASETGLDKDMVEKIIGRFERDCKIFYREGWVGIVNFIKNQNQNSPKVKKGIEIEIQNCPDNIRDLVFSKGIDTLSHSNTNTNSNSNTNLTKYNTSAKAEKKSIFSQLGADILKQFELVDPKNKTYYSNKTQRKACDFLIEEYGFDNVVNVVNILPKVNSTKLFIAQITTPYELQQNWVKLQNIIEQKKQEIITNKSKIAF